MKYVILSKETDLTAIQKYYIEPFKIELKDIAYLKLYGDSKQKKLPIGVIKEVIKEELLPAIEDLKAEYLIITDPDYFKVFAKVTKTDPNIGYVLDSPYGSFKVVYALNYKSLFYKPENIHKIAQSINALIQYDLGKYTSPGSNIIKFEQYPKTPQEIETWLNKLIEMNVPLTCDIETFSLHHYKAGLGSIAFAWNQHEGIAFKIDIDSEHKNQEVRNLLKGFFERFSNTLIFHNISYDVSVLIYQLYMEDLLDTKGLLNGINILLKNWEDTKLITYLATNSCSGNSLSLKDQSQEYTGNYAQENINDISLIKEEDLLRYNLTDVLATWYVYNKHYNKMIQDQQLDIYTRLFKPATIDIIQMQLTGMPLNMDQVLKVKKDLEKDQNDALNKIQNNLITIKLVDELKKEWVNNKNKVLKKKKVTLADASSISFNPSSPQQLQKLLYQTLQFPVLKRTKTHQPATDSDTIQSFALSASDPEVKELLEALVDFKAVDKILTAFIPAFLQAQKAKDGRYYLFGSFNLGGTVSGRLSSSEPNMQQIPATGSKYAKPIKSCFQAPEGWLMVGLDFNALEDHISALTTKDSNKLKVYIDSYDGHCLRAYSYFKDKMPDITQALEELHKKGKTIKVTFDDGSIKYFNEFNPELLKLKEQYYANH